MYPHYSPLKYTGCFLWIIIQQNYGYFQTLKFSEFSIYRVFSMDYHQAKLRFLLNIEIYICTMLGSKVTCIKYTYIRNNQTDLHYFELICHQQMGQETELLEVSQTVDHYWQNILGS